MTEFSRLFVNQPIVAFNESNQQITENSYKLINSLVGN